MQSSAARELVKGHGTSADKLDGKMKGFKVEAAGGGEQGQGTLGFIKTNSIDKWIQSLSSQ